MSRKVRYFLVISLVALAAFLSVALGTVHEGDWPFAGDARYGSVRNLSGPLGSVLAYTGDELLGRLFAWFLPLTLVILAVGLMVDRIRGAGRLFVKLASLIVLLNAFFALLSFTSGSEYLSGAVGRGLAGMLSSVLGRIGGTIIIITCLLLVLLTEVRLMVRWGRGMMAGRPDVLPLIRRALAMIGRGIAALVRRAAGWTAALGRQTVRWWERVRTAREMRRQRAEPGPGSVEADPAEDPPWVEAPEPAGVAIPEAAPADVAETADEPEPAEEPRPAERPKRRPRSKPAPSTAEDDQTRIPIEEAELPPLDILATERSSGSGFSADTLKSWSAVLEDKLANYGITGKVTAVNQGPLVTTFEFAPAPGVKIKEIVSRSDDLALAMRARSLRLIAPIPGRAVVGIEIPNPDQEMVYLRDVLAEIPDRLRLGGIMIGIGVDAVGKAFSLNLCSAPHLLMAGTTGSGKSVSLNCFLTSILFQYRPSDVRLILVDPKMVEMSVYNDIPHLLHPVITDPREAVKVFNFLIGEMGRRNELFRKNGVKNIESYNSKIALGRVAPGDSPEGPVSKLPYIVLVIDELGDLVLAKGVDIETLLSRLSNMARAVGIHMIVATQRPSVDVIVGKTKANFPTRIAFRVASKVDSRTILDCVGAEKLLGKGDMLFVDAKHPEALRLHGAWISDSETDRVIAHWKQYAYEESQLDLFEETAQGVLNGETDPYFDDAKEIILRYRQGSTSLLQRKLHIGYARAARLLDQLEQAGVVGPPDGSKPREVLIREEAVLGADLDDDSV